MLARPVTTILPDRTLPEAIETTRIHRVAGLTSDCTALVTTRPFRAPHHTISDAGLIGGGHVPMPGDASLIYHSMRFLDELPECRRLPRGGPVTDDQERFTQGHASAGHQPCRSGPADDRA
jgi:magnesium chelatase family protein